MSAQLNYAPKNLRTPRSYPKWIGSCLRLLIVATVGIVCGLAGYNYGMEKMWKQDRQEIQSYQRILTQKDRDIELLKQSSKQK